MSQENSVSHLDQFSKLEDLFGLGYLGNNQGKTVALPQKAKL